MYAAGFLVMPNRFIMNSIYCYRDFNKATFKYLKKCRNAHIPIYGLATRKQKDIRIIT